MLAGLTVLSAFALSGCIGGDELPPGQVFTYNGNTWIVADQRDAGQIAIAVQNPKLAGLGTEAAARHRVDVMPAAEYRAAVMGWFATTGRFCRPDDGTPADDDSGGYVYTYSCWLPV